MLYETNENFVALAKEITYLENYLELQKIRIDKEEVISFRIEGDVHTQKVVPLIFIPFVENAFKHGIKGDVEQVFIKIKLSIKEDYLFFNVENNKGVIDEALSEHSIGGVGLENVKKRLDLLYQNRYELKIEETQTVYCIKLKIPV